MAVDVFCCRYLHKTLDASVVPRQDALSAISFVSLNPVGKALAWDFVRQNWDVLMERWVGGWVHEWASVWQSAHVWRWSVCEKVSVQAANLVSGKVSGWENSRVNASVIECRNVCASEWVSFRIIVVQSFNFHFVSKNNQTPNLHSELLYFFVIPLKCWFHSRSECLMILILSGTAPECQPCPDWLGLWRRHSTQNSNSNRWDCQL